MQENNTDFSIIKQKILEYLKYKGISNYRCYKETGMSHGVLGQKNGISEENLIRFFKSYRDISPIWVILGEGNMLRDENLKEVEKEKESIEEKIQDVTPDFLLRRFEELVIENNNLKQRLLENKKNVVYGLPETAPTLAADSGQVELKADILQTNIQK